jgi:cell division initiation protein
VGEEPKIAGGAGPRALGKAVPPRETSAADRVRATEFPTAMRGYDREAVEGFVAQVADMIDTLESRQARETVVQRALEEVGEETSAILKQAHESADDITARSRSQAEDRVEVARQEAMAIVREAREEATELKRETEELQEERANLIEELRRFATETLAVAEAAGDRLDPSPPEGVVEASVEEPVDLPYDGADDLDPGEEWPEEEEPGEQTRELSIPSGEGRDEEPPRPGG